MCVWWGGKKGDCSCRFQPSFGALINLIPPGICLRFVYDDTAVCCSAPLTKTTLPKPSRTWLLISSQIPYRLIGADLPWKWLMGARAKKKKKSLSAFSSLTESSLKSYSLGIFCQTSIPTHMLIWHKFRATPRDWRWFVPPKTTTWLLSGILSHDFVAHHPARQPGIRRVFNAADKTEARPNNDHF